MDDPVVLLVKKIVSEWATVTAHPEAFIATLALGLFVGWVAAWLILKQRLIHHQELVEDYRNRVSGEAPITSSSTVHKTNIKDKITVSLFIFGVLFIFSGFIFSYLSSDIDKFAIMLFSSSFGLVLIFFSVVLLVTR
jgi:hypothetical protein